MASIKKGDLVQVITGAKAERGGDRGKQGRVLSIDKEKNRVIVEGVNLVKKHTKVSQTDRGTKTGGIETVEAPIHISNVALVDPSTKKPPASALASRPSPRVESRRPFVFALRRPRVRTSND